MPPKCLLNDNQSPVHRYQKHAGAGSGLQWPLRCWQGAGTAIGELPPYFMARAARLSGNIDEEEQEIEELMEEQQHAEHLVCAALSLYQPSGFCCHFL